MRFKNKYKDLFFQLSKMEEFKDCNPIILNESDNLIVHLFPYDVVARVSIINVEKGKRNWKIKLQE